MDAYWKRRVVSYAAYHIRRGKDLPATIAASLKRRPPFTEYQIREAWPDAVQSVANAAALAAAGPNVRLCDIPGCVFPTE